MVLGDGTYLTRADKRTHEYPLVYPFALGFVDDQVWFCSDDVGESDEDGWNLDFRELDDVCYEFSEFGLSLAGVASLSASTESG